MAIKHHSNENFLDNNKLTFGTSDDLQIYHDSSNSYIDETGTGDLVLNTNGASIKLLFNGSEFMGQFVANGSARLYYDNAQKFETTATGVTITGSVGIGISSPSQKLHVDGKIRANSWFQGADGTNTLWANASEGVLIETPGSTSGNNDSKIYFRNSGNTVKHTFDTNNGNATFTGSLTATSLDINGNADISGDLTMSGHKIVKFASTTYGAFDSEDFFRIKFQDVGGTHNDVGIGQTAANSLGFNITSGGSFLFNGGTSGNALTLTSGGNATFAGTVTPSGNGAKDLGGASNRWATVYASNVNTNTSSTFGGDIVLDDNVDHSPNLYFYNQANNYARLYFDTNNDLLFKIGTSTELALDGTSATFSGLVKTTDAGGFVVDADVDMSMSYYTDVSSSAWGIFSSNNHADTIISTNLKIDGSHDVVTNQAHAAIKGSGVVFTGNGHHAGAGAIAMYALGNGTASAGTVTAEENYSLLITDTTATFAGRVDAPNMSIGDTDSLDSSVKLRVAGNLQVGSDNSGGAITKIYESSGLNLDSGSSSRNIYFRINGTEKLKIDTSGNSIFAGDVNLSNSNGSFIYLNTNTGAADTGLFLTEGSTANKDQNGFKIYYSGSGNTLKIDSGTSSLTNRVSIARDTGEVTFASDVTTSGYYFANTHFRSTDAAAVLSTTGAGIIYLRPNAYDSTTGQLTLDSSGNATFAGGITVGEDDTGHDVKFFGATSGRYLHWDESADSLILLDNVQLQVGSDADIRMLHDGTDSKIRSTTSDLYITQEANDKDIIFQSDDGSGGVETYFYLDGGNNNIKFVRDTNWIDNEKATFGSSGDLQILHNATNSYIQNYLGDLYINNWADNKDIIFQSDDGSGGVTPYITLDGSHTKTIMGKTIHFDDNVKIQMGNYATPDLKIWHDGTDSVIQNDTGDLELQNRQDDGDIVFKSDDGSGGVTEYFRLDGGQTQSIFSQNAQFQDNVRCKFGTSADLQIFHDGSNSYINEVGSGSLVLQSSDLFLRTNTSENAIVCAANASVTLYYDNAAKLATTSGGVDITGELEATSLDINGVADISGDLTLANSNKIVLNGGMNTAGNFDAAKIRLNSSNTVDTTGFHGIRFATSSSNNYGWSFGANRSSSGRGSLRFYEHNNANAGTERFTLLQDGNVGIGNANPTSAKLVIREDSSYGLRLEDAAGHYFRVNTGGDTEIRGNVTTGGDVTVDDGYIMVNGGTTSNTTTEAVLWARSQIGASIAQINVKGDQWQFGGGGSVDASPTLILDYGDNSATFAGDVSALRFDMNPNFAASNEYLILSKGQSQDGGILLKSKPTGGNGQNDWQILNHSTTGDLRFYAYGLAGFALTLDRENGNATFAGGITVGEDDTGYDVTFYGATSGRYVQWDESENSLDFRDTTFLRFGNGDDFQFSHTGSESNITNYTGDIVITNNANDKDIIFQSDDGSGGVETYFFLDGSTGHTQFPDAKKLMFGSSNDMFIEHDGSNSYISQGGTGDLYIRNTTADNDIRFVCDDGSGGNAEYFRLDGGEGHTIANKEINFLDSVECTFGNGNDLKIAHISGNNYITGTNGDLYIRNGSAADKDIIFQADNGSGGNAEYFRLDGGGELTFFSKNLQMADNARIFAGDAGDLQIYHDGNHSVINNATGHLYISNEFNDGDIVLRSDDGSGGVTEYFKLDGGVGYMVASKAIRALDSVNLQLGASADFTMQHNGSNTVLQNFTGDLQITQGADDKDIIFQSDDGSGGTTEYFRLDGSSVINVFNKQVYLPDNIPATFGDGSDLRILHAPDQGYIQNYTGDFHIQQRAVDKDLKLYADDGSGGVTEYLTLDGGAGQIHLQKTVGIGTTSPDTAYKLDVAGKAQVQSVLELDDVLTLNQISTPSDPAPGKSSIYMDSADGAIRVKINVGGTVVTRTLASFE